MTRHVTDAVIAKLKQWEGERLTAYRDSGGVLTIGTGHTGPDVWLDMTITAAHSEKLLRADLAKAEGAVDSLVKVPLNDNQFGTLVSLTFNIGVAAFKGSTLLRKLNGGDYASVPGQLAKWVNDNGKKVDGLVNRRAAEAGLWATGAPVSSRNVVPSSSWLSSLFSRAA